MFFLHKDNLWLRKELKNYNVKQYELAKFLGYSEWQFSKLLREPIDKKTIGSKWSSDIRRLSVSKRF